jgi:hypothetical protein
VDLNRLTQKQVCALLACEDRTLRNWAKDNPPIPAHGKGKGLYYVWVEVFEWWREREFQNLLSAARKSDDAIPVKSDWEAIEQKVDAELKLIKLAEAKKFALPREETERRWASIMAKVRTQLLSIGNRIRGKWGREVADDVQAEINKACSMLAQGAIRKELT